MTTSRPRIALAAAVAVVGIVAAAAPTGAGAAATTGLDPLAVAQAQLAGCQAWLAQHPTSNTAQATRMKQCVTDEQAIIAALTPTPAPTTPAPSASPSPMPSPSGSAPTTPPVGPPTPTTPPPTPSSTPTPSPTIQPAVACMDNPAACGYPDMTNTGVPAGTTLTTTGSMTLTAPGTYSGLDIRGCVTVASTGVTLTRSRVSGCTGSYAVRVDSASAGFVMSDSEIVMQGDQKGLVFVGYTAERLKVTGTGDCFGTGTNSVIQDSYCENGPGNSPKRAPNYGAEPSWCGTGAHWDGVEAGATTRTIIRHNTFRLPCGQTSNIGVSDWNDPGLGVSGVLIDNNLLAGGGWTVYCGTPASGGTGTTLTNNRFSRWYWPGGGSANNTEATQANCWNAARSGNVWDESSQPV